ncbi:ABC transporter ATP-binding protein [Clostridium sp. UBA6640]|uniref:ABC transporter ATP-binding protein n=1 Tax=Clostridium sp. UBA6640 TaxID=1946370 RepID=UPI0025BB8D4E|nr:ATP-binding cassette domain-containing protein [Clostridium sp. UBA6640]
MEAIVKVDNVRKCFYSKKKKFFRVVEKKEFKAVDGVSFEINKGEVFGLLGPNGAGKTTVIKMITGLLRPTSGQIKIKGLDVDKNSIEALRNLGTVLAGDRSIYWKLTARENLEYFGALYGLNKKEAAKRADEILKKLGLVDKADELVEKYSTGMKQKVALGKALMPNAPIVLLDEPTLGLDPQSALNLREIILDIKNEGRTVLLTTHYMEEADFLSDRIAIMDGGKIIALDTPENLKSRLNDTKSIKVELNNCSEEFLECARNIDEVDKVISNYVEDKRIYEIIIQHHSNNGIMQNLLECISNNGLKVININVLEPSLEDVFIHLTGKSLRE